MKKLQTIPVLLALTSLLSIEAKLVFDTDTKTFVESKPEIRHPLNREDEEINSKILRFENIKINEHTIYDLKELEPEPIKKIEIEAFKELEIIDISGEIAVSPDDFDFKDGELYTSLFYNDNGEFTKSSRHKLNKMLHALEGFEGISVRIESNFYSLENEEYNYSKSISNAQNLKDILLLNTYTLENDVNIIPFGSHNKICFKNIPQCRNANTRIELFVTSKK